MTHITQKSVKRIIMFGTDTDLTLYEGNFVHNAKNRY